MIWYDMAYFLKEIIPLPKVLLEGTSSPKTTMETTRKLIFVKTKTGSFKKWIQVLKSCWMCTYCQNKSRISRIVGVWPSLKVWGILVRLVWLDATCDYHRPFGMLSSCTSLATALTLRVWGVIWALRGPVWQVNLGDMGGQKSGISGGRWWRHQWVHGRFSVSNQPVYPSAIFRVWLDLCRYCLWDYENPIHVEMVWGR